MTEEDFLKKLEAMKKEERFVYWGKIVNQKLKECKKCNGIGFYDVGNNTMAECDCLVGLKKFKQKHFALFN